MAPVSFSSVSKKFRRGERHDSLRDLLPSLVRRLAGAPIAADDLEATEFWAVRDVSFEINPGQALGIIGHNGAGKSTILKLLTKILRPTQGTCRVSGRVGALIEVAAGFHPDLTGRENVYLQGAIMGMRQREVTRKLDAIVEFAGITDFLDTPVKRYSSGMNARLGFAIAAHLEPDVLIIDEVLSVGDMAFQERCLKRMRDFKRQGAAIAFVSHNLQAVSELCDTVLVMERGRPQFIGPVSEGLEFYLKTARNQSADSAGGAAAAVLINATVIDGQGGECPVVEAGTSLEFVATLKFVRDADDVSFGLIFVDGATGNRVAGANSASLGAPNRSYQAGSIVTVRIRFMANLARGQYLVEFHAATASTMVFHLLTMPAVVLSVRELISPFGVAFLGFNSPVVLVHDLRPEDSADPTGPVFGET